MESLLEKIQGLRKSVSDHQEQEEAIVFIDKKDTGKKDEDGDAIIRAWVVIDAHWGYNVLTAISGESCDFIKWFPNDKKNEAIRCCIAASDEFVSV